MNVEIYTTPTCAYCKMAKAYLTEKGIEYTEFNVAGNMKKAEELRLKSGQMGVPVLDIEGRVIIGFNKHEIAKALEV